MSFFNFCSRFSGIFNHLSKIIKELKKEKNFENEKSKYAYYCQKYIFKHLLNQLNKIMYFSELHFNIKNLFIVGGVGCNKFLFESLKILALNRNKIENQLKEYIKLKKRLKKKIKKIENNNFLAKKNLATNNMNDEIELSSSFAWNFYLKNLLKKKTSNDILLALRAFDFNSFTKLKEKGSFLLQDQFLTPSVTRMLFVFSFYFLNRHPPIYATPRNCLIFILHNINYRNLYCIPFLSNLQNRGMCIEPP